MTHPDPLSLSPARVAWISAIALVLGVLFDLCFWDQTPGLAFVLYVLLILAGLLTLSRACRRPLQRDAVGLFVPLVFFAAMVFVRASEPLTLLNLAACLLLLLLIAETATFGSLRRFSVAGYLRLATLPVRFVRPLYRVLLALIAPPAGTRERSVQTQVFRGLFIALPVLLLFLALFSSADLVFRDFVSRLVDFQLREETMARIILVVLATLVLIGAYGYALLRPEQTAPEGWGGGTYRMSFLEAAVVLGSVNLLFLVFIVIQFAYLFGGERVLAMPGMTYAEYARHGFFELIAVAGISWLLLLLLDHFVDRQRPQPRVRFKILGTLLVVQVAIIMASAHFRLSLYEAAYGFTIPRLFSHAVIILLAAVFALLLDKILRSGADAAFAFRVFLSLVLFLAVMNLLNPEAFIARRNIDRFAATGKLDTGYLGQLSDDAVPSIVSAMERADAAQQDSLAPALLPRAADLARPQDWQSLNLSRLRARRILLPWIAERSSSRDALPQPTDSTAAPVRP